MTHFEEQKNQAIEPQNHDELSFEDLDEVSGGRGLGVEIKDAGGLISKGIGALKKGVDKADDWRRTDRGPNVLRHLGSIKLG
jgi:hypothetical protein